MADTTQRAAMQQAQQALERAKTWCSFELHKAFVRPECGAAITALRAALAEQAAEQAEPVAAGYALVPVEPTEAMLSAIDMTHSCAPIDQWSAAIAAAPPAPARQPAPALTVGMLMEAGLMVGSTPDSVGTSNWAVRMLGALRALAVDQPDAPPAPARQEWQPIETAPTDTEVLIGAWIDGEFKWGRSVRFYDSGNEREGEPACGWVWSIDDCSDSVAENPTHWQPLPAAPITAAPDEGGA